MNKTDLLDLWYRIGEVARKYELEACYADETHKAEKERQYQKAKEQARNLQIEIEKYILIAEREGN